ncbi:MAG: DUF3667 domain-containing protein [Longimicrobiales bacterium]
MNGPDRPRCENCGEPLRGSYCAQCGQSDADYDVPIRQFATEFLSESFDLDARLRRTLRPLFLRPGLVPAEYVSGHRARFVPPVRLYVFASFAVFLLLSVTSGPLRINLTSSDGEPVAPALSDSIGPTAPILAPVDDTVPDRTIVSEADTTVDQNGSLIDRLMGRMTAGLARVQDRPDQFAEAFINRLAQAMFFLLPAFALILKLLYRGRLYVHHLVFAIYFHSFAFLWIAMMELIGATGLPVLTTMAELAAVFGLPVYLFLAMRRFYGGGRAKTLLRFAFLSVSYVILLNATILGLIGMALLAA